MKKQRLLHFFIILIVLTLSANAIEECNKEIKYNEIPCNLYLGISNYSSCDVINITVYNETDELFTAQMGKTTNPYICNFTFNISSIGTYTFKYYDGNFTDTGSLIVRGAKMELLIYFGLILSAILFFIAYFSRDSNILTLSGFSFSVLGIIILIVGFGNITNTWTNAIGIIVLGIGLMFSVIPNLEKLKEIF